MRAAIALRLAVLTVALVICGCSDKSPAGTGDSTCADGCRDLPGRDLGQSDAAEDPTDVAPDPGDAAEDGTGDASDATGDLSDAPEPQCEPGTHSCFDAATAATCNADGLYEFEDCVGGQVCQDGACTFPLVECTPNEALGCIDATNYRVCNATGDGYDTIACPSETPNCLAELGQCSTMACVPGSVRCASGDSQGVEACAEDGSGYALDHTCEAGLTCDSGQCLSPCEINDKVSTFIGCDLWAVDLDNLESNCALGCESYETCNETTNVCEPSAASQTFAVALSNPNSQPVDVSITNQRTGTVVNQTVDPLTSVLVPLERNDVNGTGSSDRAFHVVASLPITAHQFNPANNANVFSNDASLLLPTNAAGLHYIVLDWPTGPYGYSNQPFGSDQNQGAFAYATVVAVTEGTTHLTVTPSSDVQAGGDVAALSAGVSTSFDLAYGHVLNLETAVSDGLDLTGTRIDADQPVMVFAGHECAFVPDDPLVVACDHIEQQLYPVEAWGSRYFATKFHPRGTEVDFWRVVATADGTLLRTNPIITGVNGVSLNAGAVLEFSTDLSFELSASAPILAGQFMVGSNYPGIPTTCPAYFTDFPCSDGCPSGTACVTEEGYCGVQCTRDSDCRRGGLGLNCNTDTGWCAVTGLGDPAYTLSIPVSQYRDNYVFLTPEGYAQDWATVVAPMGTTLTFDGTAVTAALTAISDTGYGTLDISTSDTDGGADPAVPHTLTGSAPFGLVVYGYSCDVSYAYPGGLNLEPAE